MKRRAPTSDDVISLAPGKTMVAVAQLSSAYDMSKTGNYLIQYDMPTERVLFQSAQTSKSIATDPNSILQAGLDSNHLQLTIEGRPNNQFEQINITKVQQRVAAPSYIYCSTNMQNLINIAFSSARTYADNSFTYLSNTAPYVSIRYKTWFGTYTSTYWNAVKIHYQNIKYTYNFQALVFNCGCTIANTYAYVYANRPYMIYLCPAFWSAPMIGTDSKAGTIIHETSHFLVVAATQDNVYGQSLSKNLAMINPLKAIQNADSHEYFAENNPSLK
jgi:peptidyl-Lys metalloendopeptidase